MSQCLNAFIINIKAQMLQKKLFLNLIGIFFEAEVVIKIRLMDRSGTWGF